MFIRLFALSPYRLFPALLPTMCNAGRLRQLKKLEHLGPLVFASLLLVLLSSKVYALTRDDVDFSGFGTVGMVLSDSNTYGYRVDVSNDDGVFDGDVDFLSISNLGLQFDIALSETSLLTFQAVAKDQADTAFLDYVTQAFYKHEFSPSIDLRLGRMPLDLFALADHRNIGFSYTWSALPAETYSLYPVQHLDGGDLSYTIRPGTGTIVSTFFTGKTDFDVGVYGQVSEVNIKNIIGTSITWSDLSWQFKANYSRLEMENTGGALEDLRKGAELFDEGLNALTANLNQFFPTAYPSDLWLNSERAIADTDLDGEFVHYYSISGNYTWNSWTLAAEVTRVTTKTKAIPSFFSSYLSLEYSRGKSTYYGLIAKSISDTEDFDDSGVSELITRPDSPLLDPNQVGPLADGFQALLPQYPFIAQGYQQIFEAYDAEQKTFAVGWRHDLKSNISLNVQLNHTVVKDRGGPLWWIKEIGPTEGESINTAFFSLSFIF